jgi:hypothetical protein
MWADPAAECGAVVTRCWQYRCCVSTRTLLILAAITGLVILVAFAVQVTIAAS